MIYKTGFEMLSETQVGQFCNELIHFGWETEAAAADLLEEIEHALVDGLREQKTEISWKGIDGGLITADGLHEAMERYGVPNFNFNELDPAQQAEFVFILMDGMDWGWFKK